MLSCRNFVLMLALAAALPAGATPPPLATIPFRAVGSTILLPVSVNGGETAWFMLDSGGNSCALDKGFARRIGLRPVGQGESSGAGHGAVPYDRYDRPVRFSVGGVPFACPDNHVIGLDFSAQPAIIGTAIDGIIGTDFLAQYVVEVDYGRRVVRAYDPAGFRYTGTGCHVPMTVDERRLPHVDARLTVDGRLVATRRLLVDSGSQSAVDDSWINRARRLRSGTGGVGLGQSYQTRIGRFSAVRIGCFTVADVPGSGDGVPLVGGEVLRQFTLIFDWRRRELILEPGAGFARSLAESGAAGLDLRAGDHGTILIDGVSPQTPAARAGLVAGDILDRVDGTPAGAFDFAQLGQLFRPGRSYRLEVLRGGARHSLQLDLQDPGPRG